MAGIEELPRQAFGTDTSKLKQPASKTRGVSVRNLRCQKHEADAHVGLSSESAHRSGTAIESEIRQERT